MIEILLGYANLIHLESSSLLTPQTGAMTHCRIAEKSGGCVSYWGWVPIGYRCTLSEWIKALSSQDNTKYWIEYK